MGFGNDNNYISLGVDFDGSLKNHADLYGIGIYPPCFADGQSLATGNIRDVLRNSSVYASGSSNAIRHAFAGGDRNNWEQLGGSRVDNGDSWPGTFFRMWLRLHFVDEI